MKNLTDFHKTAEVGVDPFAPILIRKFLASH